MWQEVSDEIAAVFDEGSLWDRQMEDIAMHEYEAYSLKARDDKKVAVLLEKSCRHCTGPLTAERRKDAD